MDDKIIIMFKNMKTGSSVDLEVPANLSANEFINGLNKGLSLGIDMEDPKECYMKSKDPIALIRGEATLEEIGLRNGSTVFLMMKSGTKYPNGFSSSLQEGKRNR